MKITRQPPVTVVAGEYFNPEVEVSYLDNLGNVDKAANKSVTVALEANPGNATLQEQLIEKPVQGITKFPRLKITKAAAGYTLKVTNPDGLAEISDAFDVGPAAPDALKFTSTAHTLEADTCSLSPVTFQIVDAYDNISPLTAAETIQLSGPNLSFYTDASCTNLITQTVLNSGDSSGSFYFKGTVAGQKALTIASTNLNSVFQNQTITPRTVGQLAFLSNSQTLTAGQCSGAATIESQDLFGNTASVDADKIISLSGNGMTFYQDSSCATSAITDITLLMGTSTGTFYFKGTEAGNIDITAASPALASAIQTEVINPDVGVALAFNVEPTDAIAGAAINPSVVVSIVDQFGNIATASQDTITLNIENNPSGTAILVGGVKTLATSSGVATFSGANELKIEKADLGYTLKASSPLFGQVVSASFDITHAPIDKMVFLTSAQTLLAGACSAVTTVQMQDQYNNVASPQTDTTITYSGTGLVFYSDASCTTTITSQVLTTANNSLNFYFEGTISGNPISLTATATAGDTISPESQDEIINPDIPSILSFTTSPHTTVAGQCAAATTVQVEDQYGNIVTSSLVTPLSLSASIGTTTFYSDSACTSGNEITSVDLAASGTSTTFYYSATTSGTNTLSLNGNLRFSDGNDYAISGNQAHTITHDVPAQLSFKTEPALNTEAGVAISPAVEVSALDQYGNLATSFVGNISLDIEDNPPGTGALVGGAKTQTAVAGVAIFSGANNLQIQKAANGYSLNATSGSLIAAESTSFNITPGAASKYRYTATPQTTQAGYCSSLPVAIATEDSYGNSANVSGPTAITFTPNPATAGSITLFSDSTCSTPATLSMAAGTNSFTFYFKGTIAGTNSMTLAPAGITCDTGMGCTTTNTQSLTITPDTPYKLSWVSSPIVSPNEVVAGDCSPEITLRSEDQFGNPSAISGTNQIVELLPSSGNLYPATDTTCSTPIVNASSPLEILVGNIEAKFRFMTTVTAGGFFTVTAQSDFSGTFADGLASPHTSMISQQQAMKAAPPDHFFIEQQPLQSVAGQPIQGPFKAQLRDRFDNLIVLSSAKSYLNIDSFSPAIRPTLYGGTGMTSVALSPTNPPLKDYFPNPSVQSLWVNAEAGILEFANISNSHRDISIQKVGTYTFRLSALGIDFQPATAISASFDVVNAPPSKLAFLNTPYTRVAGTCSGAVSVQAQDPYDNSAIVSENKVLTPTGTGFTFFSDSLCTPGNEITTLDLLNGTDSVTFYYINTVASPAQNLTVQVTSGSVLTAATQAQVITPDVPHHLAYITPSRTLVAGVCSAAITLQAQDQYNNPSPLTGTDDGDINLATLGNPVPVSVGFYSDSGCTTSIGTATTILTGTSNVTLYARGTLPGTIDVTATPDFRVAGSAVQTETIVPAPVSQIVFLSNGTQTLTAGQCSALVTFELQDAFNNPVNGLPTTVGFSLSMPGFVFYSDASCTTTIPNISVGTGTTQGSFYFRSTVSGSRDLITNIASPVVQSTQTQLINPAGFERFAFTNGTATISALTLTAGQCSALTVEAQDAFGNRVDSDLASQRVILQGSPANTIFYTSSGCNNGDELPLTAGGYPNHPNMTYVDIIAAKQQTFYIKNTVSGASTLTALHNGVTYDGTLNLTINPSTPSKLAFAAQPIQSIAGSPLVANGPTTVQIRVLDQYDNLTASTASIVLALDPANTNNNGVALLGTTTVAAVAGTANFSTVNITEAGTDYSLKATSAGLTEIISNYFPVVAAEATHVEITTASPPVTAGQCSLINTLTIKDTHDNVATATSNLDVTLAGSNVTFYTDNTCSTPAAGGVITILNGQSTADFYFIPTESGTITITAERTTAPILSAGTSDQTVTPDTATQIAFSNAPRTDIIAAQCSGATKVVTLQLRDQFGNNTTNTSGSGYTINFDPVDATAKLYSDNSCTSELPVNGSDYQISIANGSGSYNIYISGTKALNLPLTVNIVENSWTASQTETIIAAPASELNIPSLANSNIIAGTCSSSITIESTDANGNPSPVVGPKVITLSPIANLTYYSDSSCLLPITTATIPDGSSSVDVYFRSEIAGNYNVELSAPGLTSTSQTQTVTFGAVNKLGFSVDPSNTVAGTDITPAVEISALDQYGNLVTTFNDPITVSIDINPGGGTLSGTNLANATSGVATYGNLSIEKIGTGYQLLATSPGLVAASSSAFNILPNIAHQLYFVTAAQSLDVNNCSGATTVGVRDIYNNNTVVTSDTAVDLGGAGFTFYSDSACTSAITASTINSGSGTSTFWFKSSASGVRELTATNGGLIATNQFETITPGVVTRLGFASAPQTVQSGECSAAVTVQSQDANQNPSPAAGPIVVTTVGSNFEFFSDASCTMPLALLTIATGTDSAEFYFKGANIGNSTILLTAAGLGPNPTQIENITPGIAADLNFTSAEQNLLTDECSSLVTFETRDINGNVTSVAAPVDIDLTPTLGLTFYSDNLCTNPITTVTINPDIPSVGQSHGSFYFKTGTLAGTASTEISVGSDTSPAALKFGNRTDTLDHSVTARLPSKVLMSGDPQTIRATQCSGAITVQSADLNDNVSPLVTPTVVSYTANQPVQFFSDSNCQNVVSPANQNMGAGQSAVTIYFKTNLSNANLTIRASATVEGNASFDDGFFNVTPASATSLVFTSTPSDSNPILKVDQCYAVYNTSIQDIHGNPTTGYLDYDIVLSSVYAQYYRDAACTDEILPIYPSRDRVITIPVGQSSAPAFYFKSLQIGEDRTIASSNAGLENAIHSFEMVPNRPEGLVFDSYWYESTAGVCSAPVDIMVTDRVGFETTVPEDLEISLAFAPIPDPADVAAGRINFFSDETCSSEITDFIIPSGQSRGQFYYRIEKAGFVYLEVSGSDTVSDPDIILPMVSQGHLVRANRPYQLDLAPAPDVLNTNTCSPAIYGRFKDVYGNLSALADDGDGINNASDGLGIISSNDNDALYFRDPLCTNPIAGNSFIFSGAPFYVRTPNQGTLTVSVTTGAQIPVASFTANVQTSPLDKVAITSAPPRLGYWVCSPQITIEYQDSTGVAIPVAQSGGVDVGMGSLYSNFYSASDCNNSSRITSVNIPEGQSTASFYFRIEPTFADRNSLLGRDTNWLFLNGSALAAGAQEYEMIRLLDAAPIRTTLPNDILIGSCVKITDTYRNVDNDPESSNGSNWQATNYAIDVTMTGSNLNIFSDSNCSSPWVNPTSIPIGGGDVEYYIKVPSTGVASINYSANALNSKENQTRGKDRQIKFLPSPAMTLPAGVCTEVVIQSQNELGAPTAITGAPMLITPIYTHITNNNIGSQIQSFSDASCTTKITDVTLAVGQHSESIYIQSNWSGENTNMSASLSSLTYMDPNTIITGAAGTMTQLVPVSRNGSTHTVLFDSLPMGTCSPPFSYQSRDAYGNLATAPSNINISLSAEQLDSLGYPAGPSSPQTGVGYFSDATCSIPIASTTITAGTTESPNIYLQTNFGRKQFAQVGTATFASAYFKVSSAMDKVAISSLPIGAAYECKTFDIQHQQISDNQVVDVDAPLVITVSHPGSYGNQTPISATLYPNADCSGTGSNNVSQTIIPLAGSPTQQQIEENATKVFSIRSYTLASVPITITAPSRLSTSFAYTATLPPDAKLRWNVRDEKRLVAGECSGSFPYQKPASWGTTDFINRLQLQIVTSDATGNQIIRGGYTTSADLLSPTVEYFSDTNCTVPITSVSIPAHSNASPNIYWRSTKAGPNDQAALGSLDLLGMSAKTSSTVVASQVYQIGFGSESQTIRAGQCSDPFILMVQDRYGNEQVDKSENEVSFQYPTGFRLFSDASCTISLATTYIPANQSRKTIYFTHDFAQTITVSPLPIRPLESVPQDHLILSASASKLGFANSPVSVATGQCSAPLTVQIQDNLGNAVSGPDLPASDVVVDLKAELGSGLLFYPNSNCIPGTEVTSVTILSGTNSQGFYFIGQKIGPAEITVKNNTYVDGKQTQTLLQGAPAKLGISTPIQNLQAGACSNVVTVKVLDSYDGESAANTNGNQINLSSSGGVTFYDDRFCTNPITSLTFNSGDSAKNFYFEATIAGDVDISARHIVDLYTQAIQKNRIRPAVVSGTQFITSSNTIPVGRCSAEVEIGLFDQYGNAVSDSPNVTLNFSGSNLSFFSDRQCSTPLAANEIFIRGGRSDNAKAVKLYFSANQIGNRILSVANDANLDTTSQIQTIIPSSPDHIAFGTGVRTVVANQCSQVISVITEDAFDNETPVASDLVISITPPTGAVAYSTSNCAPGSEITEVTILNGSSQADYYLKAPTTSGVISGSITSVTLGSANQNLNVVGDVPSQLYYISAAHSGVVVSTCSPIVSFGFRDVHGNTARTSGATTVDISSAGASFFSDVGCTNPITSITVPNNQLSRTFYYIPSSVGNVDITIASTGLTSATQTEAVTSGAANKLVFSSAPNTLVAGVCTLATVQTQDSLNNPSSSGTNRTVTLAASGSPTVFYGSVDCSGAPTSTVTQIAGSTSVNFSFLTTQVGSANLTASSSGLSQGAQTQTIIPAAPAKLAFTTSPRTATAGACSSFVVIQSQDIYNNPSPVAGNTTVSLISGPLDLFSDSSCSSPLGSATIASGTHSATLYFSSTQAGNWPLDISASGLTSASQTEQINADAPQKLVFLNAAHTINAGTCAALNIQIQDQYNNPSNVSGSTTLNYSTSGAPALLYSDAGCTTQVSSQNITTGNNSLTTYFRSNSTGTTQVTVASAGLTSAQQTETMTAGAATQIAFLTSALTVNANQCSGEVGPITVQVQDLLGNPATQGSASSFTLSGTGYTFYSDSGCSSSTSTLAVPMGSHTASFYFRKSSISATAINVAMSGFTSINQTQTVLPLTASKLGMSTPTQTINVATCSPVTIQTQDSLGNAVVRAQDTIANLTVTAGSLAIFSDSGCSTPTSTVTVPDGSSSAPLIYVRTTAAGSATLQASDNAAVLSAGNQVITINAGAPDHIAFITAAQTLTVGTCSGALTIQTQDVYNNPTNMTINRTVNLTATAVAPASDGILFYSDSSCSSQITSTQMTTSSSNTTVYFRGLRAMAHTVTATPTTGGYAAINQSATLNSGPVNSVVVTSGSPQSSLVAGTCSAAVVIETRDAYNNPTRPAADANFTLSQAQVNFFSNSGCSTPITQATILSSGTSTQFYYRGTLAGSYTINITGPVSTTAATTIIPGAASLLKIVSPITATRVDSCSTAMTVKTTDDYDNDANVSGNKTIVLSAAPSMGQYYSDLGCVTPLANNEVIINNGSSVSNAFYYKHSASQTVSLYADNVSFTQGTTNITVSNTGPLINLYRLSDNLLIASGTQVEWGIATEDTSTAYYVRNDGTSATGTLNIQLITDPINPVPVGSSNMWAILSDFCTGQTLAPGSYCTVTVTFKAQSGGKPAGDYYYSNIKIQANPVPLGDGSLQMQFYGIKQ